MINFYAISTITDFRNMWEIVGNIWENGENFHSVCPPLRHPARAFRRTPESAQLTGSLLQLSPTSPNGHLIVLSPATRLTTSIMFIPEGRNLFHPVWLTLRRFTLSLLYQTSCRHPHLRCFYLYGTRLSKFKQPTVQFFWKRLSLHL